jgi:DNA repair exonuclease SbcCD nuclease subunit
MIEFIGIGDLHLDGKLKKYIPDFNAFVLGEIAKPVAYAKRNGVKNVIFYGDISDVPRLSADATLKLLDLFLENPDIQFYMYPGNHDYECEGVHSLQVLAKLSDTESIPNLHVIEEPTDLFTDEGCPVRILPWPHFQVSKKALNLAHIEVHGAQWDHGSSVSSERNTQCHLISGHLHTKQVVGPKKNVHYCGTLYQTSFGEREEKYFHHVKWNGKIADITYVRTKPKYTLHNLVISSVVDLEKIDKNPCCLYKVFVKSGTDLGPESLAAYPNVVKTNPFSSRKELESLLADELFLPDGDGEVTSLSVLEALKSYMVRANADKKVTARAIELFEELSRKSIGTDK